jgi:hypothetical protein
MIILKNISGDVLQLHVHEFAIDEEIAVDSSWYVDNVVCAIMQGAIQVINQVGAIENKLDQVEWLRGNKPLLVASLPEAQPFALPSYRTKRTAVDSIAQCPRGESTPIDYRLLSERYIHGGSLFGRNVELGDYVTADLMDLDGVIPEQYRPVLCEDWPIVARYIEKEFVSPCGKHDINTYPLNAKIAQGLYLRITFHAINVGADREIAVNYYLTKKL